MKTFTLGALFLAFPAFATTLVALDLPALSRASDAIVQGKVAKVEAKMSKDGRRITTHITLEFTDALKGSEGVKAVEIVQPGGVVGDVGQKVAGTVHLQVGDEVVTFLERRGAQKFMLTGMAQGCFRVERSSDGNAAFAVQDVEGDVLMLDPVTHAPVNKGTGPMKLDELKAKVRAALAAPGVAEDPRNPTGPVQREPEVIAVAVLAALLSQNPYNRSKVRPGDASDHCLYWANTTVTWHANQAGNDETPGETEFDAFRASFSEWNGQLASCGNLLFNEGPKTTSRKIGWLKNASEIANNENILVFRQTKCSQVVPSLTDACWDPEDDIEGCGNKYDCWEHQTQAIALTTTTYDPQSGRILDADIELNVPSFIFSTVDSPKCVAPAYSTACVAWDLQNTVTHEIGHMMGLDHTTFANSTMNPTAPPGELSKRNLDTGTRSFVCNVYPKGETTKDCVVRPVDSKLGNVAVGCNCGSASGLLVLPALLALLRRRRRA